MLQQLTDFRNNPATSQLHQPTWSKARNLALASQLGLVYPARTPIDGKSRKSWKVKGGLTWYSSRAPGIEDIFLNQANIFNTWKSL